MTHGLFSADLGAGYMEPTMFSPREFVNVTGTRVTGRLSFRYVMSLNSVSEYLRRGGRTMIVDMTLVIKNDFKN